MRSRAIFSSGHKLMWVVPDMRFLLIAAALSGPMHESEAYQHRPSRTVVIQWEDANCKRTLNATALVGRKHPKASDHTGSRGYGSSL